MFVRYAMLLAASAVAVWGAVNLGTSNTNAYLVDAGQVGNRLQPLLGEMADLAFATNHNRSNLK